MYTNKRLHVGWRSCLCALVGTVSLIAFAGCDNSAQSPTVTLYCSVDEPFARSVVAAFEKESGIRVLLQTDTEAGKTTGLVRKIEAEKDQPRADVFWSSELFNTIQMADAGLLAKYEPPAEGIPQRYRDPKGYWTAIGLRGRVIGYNTEKLDEADVPKQWKAMADRRWEGKLGVADPRFGTTRGHFAAFLALWGEQEYRSFVSQLAETLDHQLMSGNATAAQFVGRGELWLCSTDTDDVYARQANGEPVAMVYPDMGDGGTLLIPNSVAMVAGGPNPEQAKVLIDFLTSAKTERMLAESTSHNIPVRASLREELGMELPPETNIEFSAIADAMDKAIQIAGELLIK